MADPSIVYVAPRPPYPLRSGIAIRQFHLLMAYRAVGNVRLVFFHRRPEDVSECEPLRAYCSSLHPVAVSTTDYEQRILRLPGWQKRLEYVRTPRPFAAASCYSGELRDVLLTLAASADLVHVARLAMVPHVESLLRDRRRPRLVLDLDDVETISHARFLRAGFEGYGKGLVFGCYDLVRLRRYQRWATRAFDRVFVCSRGDQDRVGRGNVVVVPNGTEIPPTAVTKGPDGNTVLLCGSLSWAANVDAALVFVRKILPHIRRGRSDVRVLIVGSHPAPEIQALGDGVSVFVHADVPSMEEYYRQATLMVVPLRVGGGTRIKILEALSYGVPVVSTTIGCEGLDVMNGEHLFVEDDGRRFADRCVELLRDPGLRRRLAVRGRALVAERYTWASVRTRVADIALELTSGRLRASV